MPDPFPEIRYPADLPICARRAEIVAALREHRVLIVAGETGSGKTTQLPKMCLEAGFGTDGKIGCTQPRRVAAMSVSKRVAEELRVTWGREVGCKMRFNDDTGRDTRVKFMTDGILLAEIQSDPHLRAYSVLILDEAHERSLNIDFLLGYLQGLLQRRPDLRLVITSATIDTAAFSKAFGGAPIFEVSGRLYPVDIRYAASGPLEGGAGSDAEGPWEEDAGIVAAAARAAEDALIETDSGDVLIFMPTERDIRETKEILEGRLGSEVEVLGLFGRMSNTDQQRIFAPGAKRRVIVATNIAETSITIPRIGTVIDSGLVRMSRYNPRTRTKRLPVEPISQSSANQRAGRAGRVRNGVCIRLYSQEDFEKRPQFTQPEIQRANLAEVILRMRAFRLGDVENFPFLNPPQSAAIRAGYLLLQELGALSEVNELTPLGLELARLPVDPTLGRMLLQARTEGVLPEMLVIAAGLSVPDPRERPEDAREAAEASHKAFQHAESDFLTLLNLWSEAPEPDGKSSKNALRRFCKTRFLSWTRMREWRDVHKQLEQAIEERLRGDQGGTTRRSNPGAGGAAEEETWRYGAIHRSVLAGLLSQVGQRQERNTYKASADRLVTVFPGSTIYERAGSKKKQNPEAAGKNKPAGPASRQPQWIVTGEIVQTSQLFARNIARIDPQWVVDLGAHLCNFRHVLPQWNARAGRVLVWERVLLHGLELSKRQVDYGRINPGEATEIFIRSALVAEEVQLTDRFFAENRKLREKVESALTRVRNHRVEDLDEAFFRFYAARLEKVSSVHDLNRVTKEALRKEPNFLCATESDLVGEVQYDRALFPDHVELGNAVIPLSYSYEPGAEGDGVTLKVPLSVAERLSAGELQWMVPGLREEQVGGLLRALPKTVRKQLMPIEPKIREVLEGFTPGKGDLRVELAQWIARKYRVAIRAEDWRDLPDYLRPRVEVVDRHNRTLAAGRDLGTVHAAIEARGIQSDEWEKAARKHERRGMKSWAFGSLPESLVVEEIAGAPLLAYPGLKVCDGAVDLVLFRKREEAEALSRSGLRWLGELALQKEVAWLGKELRLLARRIAAENDPGQRRAGSFGAALSELTLAPRGSGDSRPEGHWDPERLQTAGFQHVLDHLLRLECPLPLEEKRFLDMLETARAQLPAVTYRLGELTQQIHSLRRKILQKPKPYPGLEKDVDRLVAADFLERTPHARLPHVLRYLRAIEVRAERAALNPSKDAEKARQLAPFAGWETRVPVVNREAFGWMLEEFRVSVFAQELGTDQPVSVQRLKALGGM